MKRFSFIFAIFAAAAIVSCQKKPLTLDDETSMKTLLKASDAEIKELFAKEAAKKMEESAENIEVEYILRDKENQALIVKSIIKKEEESAGNSQVD